MNLKQNRTHHVFYFLTFLLTGVALFLAWHLRGDKAPKKESREWVRTFKRLGTLSSPRMVDLTKDGILDVVLGAGSIEFQASDSAVLAIDGADGATLWTARARDQIFGSPVFQDITGDGVPEVFIGGRAAELKALDGKDGTIVWEYFPFAVDITQSDSGAYNFYSPQIIPDQDNDGLGDLLVAAGGYVKALPHDPNRPAGKLLVISSASGKKLAGASMPDSAEIYMSVVVADFTGNDELSVIFGTGGETLGGGLYKAYLGDLLKNDLSKATLLATGKEKGFIAPPVLADITNDETPDIIVNAVDGRMLAIDGSTNETLWEVSIPGTEAYCSIAVGFYTADQVPDFFTNFGIGIWPDLDRSVQFMVDGKTGEVMFRDTLGTFQESSPVTCDFNQDGHDDALISLNHQSLTGFSNQLTIIDFHNDSIYNTGPRNFGANVASTPWIGDLDQDGLLEIIYCNEANPFDLLSISFKEGLKITKLKTGIPVDDPLSWGGYMGSYHDGIFRGNRR